MYAQQNSVIGNNRCFKNAIDEGPVISRGREIKLFWTIIENKKLSDISSA